MPISVVSFLVKANPLTLPFIIQDTDLRGGFRVVPDIVDRDAIHPGAKRPHMLVMTASDKTIWKLADDGLTWETWVAPGNQSGAGLEILSTELPLFVDALGQLRIRPERILPEGGTLGQAPLIQSDGSIQWQDLAVNASTGTRTTVNKQDFIELETGQAISFELAMSKACMVTDLTVNAPDLLVQAFSTASRDELNPYTFKSAIGLLSDVGISETGGGLIQYNRRYALLANRDVPTNTTIYWELENQGATPVTPELSVTYLVLE